MSMFDSTTSTGVKKATSSPTVPQGGTSSTTVPNGGNSSPTGTQAQGGTGGSSTKGSQGGGASSPTGTQAGISSTSSTPATVSTAPGSRLEAAGVMAGAAMLVGFVL